MSTGMISIGISGMQAAQLALMTSEHNVTNASTPGYNRQRTIQTTNTPVLTGSGFVGQGTRVSTIERMYSGFLSTQVSRAQSSVSELDSYYSQVSQIDNMLADPSAGLSPALQDFFTGVQQVTANPSQLPGRQAMVSSAQALVSRFQGLDERLSQLHEGVNSQIVSAISSVNSYAQQIANINEQIVVAQSSISQPPNDLLDQRDQLVAELNKVVGVKTVAQDNGSFNVFIGTGQQLVVGTMVTAMTATVSTADPSRIVVGLATAGATQELPESLITGGSLGGLIRFRSESLDRVTNDLGRNAASLALTFNAQHALGQDLLVQAAADIPLATFKSDFFKISQPTVMANAGNSKVANAVVTATLSIPTSAANFTNLTGSDYRLTKAAAGYTLTRLTDGKQWSDPSIATLSTTTSATEGFAFDDTAAPMANGDSFIIEPTRNAARNLSVNSAIAADPRLIAAAAPIRTQAATANTGGAAISAGTVGTGYEAAFAGLPVTLTYSGGNLTGFPAGRDVLVTRGGVAQPIYSAPVASIPYQSGDVITIVGSTPASGISFEISGAPNNGDKFTVARNTGGVSDGRNALALGQLQTQNTMSGKTASYQSAYAQLVSDNGNKTREVKVTGAAQQALLEQSTAARESLSGVNLDEEAANLIRYQQAYQASAKIIEIGSKLFDVLLAIRA